MLFLLGYVPALLMVSLLGAAYLTERSWLRWTTIVVGAGFAAVGLLASGIFLLRILTSPGPDSGMASMLVIILLAADVAPGVLFGGAAWWLEQRAKRRTDEESDDGDG